MATKKGNNVSIDELKQAGLLDTVTAAPVKKDANGYYRTDGSLPEGYSWVTNGQQPLDVSYVEQNRGSAGNADNAFLGDDDWNAIQQYKADYEKARLAGDQAGMDAAHAAAEKIRNNYGYSGGDDGSYYNPTMAYTKDLFAEEEDERERSSGKSTAGKSGFSYEAAPQYVNQYQAKIDALTDAILNREAFQYDKESDPLYQQYEASYTRNGQRAMQDVLAQISARTGGLASSYATGASQQTFNNYMAALADKVPELRQLAYSMYLDELSQDRADLSMLQALEQGDYAKYLDMLGQYNTDRGFDYGVYRDDVADSQWQQSFDYNAGRDQVADSQWAQQFAYQQAQDALDQQNWQTQWDYQLLQDAQKAAASGKTGNLKSAAQQTADESGMSAEIAARIAQAYPSGAIPAGTWNQLVGMYGEAALTAAGFFAVAETGNRDTGKYLSVPGYGSVTYDEAERLEAAGKLVMTGVNANGDPIYALPANHLKSNDRIGLSK